MKQKMHTIVAPVLSAEENNAPIDKKIQIRKAAVNSIFEEEHMNDLFDMDLKDYNPDGKVFSRPSARAIIFREGRVLLIYSKKYNYYKFPGGGIEKGEDPKEALIREVQEESGYRIIPDSIEEYGKVLRRNKDSYDENGIFEQENFYYFCRVEDDRAEQKLDGYEAEEGFTPVWIEAIVASRHNKYECHAEGANLMMIKRDAKVMDMADLEIRKRERAKREKNAVRALGELDYQGMLDYVEEQLADNAESAESGKNDIAYSRFEHTKRVLTWAKRLYDLSENKEQLRYEDLMIATIFHDIGRNIAVKTGEAHAQAGVPLTKEYLLAHGYDQDRVEYICGLVGGHSDKYRMKEENLDKNLLLLMEADLLDDMGAQGVVMDCMITQNRNPQAHFTDCLDHIMRFTRRIQMENPMVTLAAKKLWDEKTRIVVEFTDALKNDLEM